MSWGILRDQPDRLHSRAGLGHSGLSRQGAQLVRGKRVKPQHISLDL